MNIDNRNVKYFHFDAPMAMDAVNSHISIQLFCIMLKWWVQWPYH